MPFKRIVGAVLALAFFFASGLEAIASPQSEAAIRDGLTKVERRDFAAALADFTRALGLDSADGRAVFFQGYALNRLGQFGPAYAAFARVGALRVTHPELDFEAGWAAAETGRWAEAVERLERYDRAKPGDAAVSLLLGRAHMGVGAHDRAEARLREAMARNAALRPDADYYLAQLAARRGAPAQSREALDRLLREAPDSPVGLDVRRRADAAARRQALDKPWEIYLATSFGHDDNVIALSDTIVRPADITDTGSDFFRVEAGGRYRFDIDQRTALTAGYDLRHDNYFNIGGQDALINQGSLQLTHALRSDVVLSVLLAGEHDRVDNERFRNAVTLRPAVAVQPLSWLASELFYSYTRDDYPQPTQTPQFLDRDSRLHSVGARATVPLFDSGAALEGGASLLYNDADGSDFSYHGHQLLLRVTAPLPWQVFAEAGISGTSFRFTDLNSLAPTTPAGPTAFGFKRRDDATVMSLRLSRPVFGPVTAFAAWDHTDNRSNLPVFDYDRDTVLIGLVARY